MEYEKFKKILKENDLTQRKFSEIAKIKYSTCTKWGKDDRPVSDWVESWLSLYIENKKLKVLGEKVKDMCEELNK